MFQALKIVWLLNRTCHRERKRNLVQAEFGLIRLSLYIFVWSWIHQLLRWVGKLSHYRVCGALFVVWVVMRLCFGTLLLGCCCLFWRGQPITVLWIVWLTITFAFTLTLKRTIFVLLTLNVILPTLLTLQSTVLTLTVNINLEQSRQFRVCFGRYLVEWCAV